MATFLSQTAEYALRAMVWIAAEPPGEPILARDLSSGTLIPAQYLSKILRRLVLAGVLESRKGRGGGFMLPRPAAKISFREVLEAVDAYPSEDRCAFGWGTCNPSRPCPLHPRWASLSATFRDWAETSNFGALQEGPVRRAPRAASSAFERRRQR